VVNKVEGRTINAAVYSELRDLNLSSNVLHNHPPSPPTPTTLSFLHLTPNLRTLDLSANYLSDLNLLPRLPNLLKLNASYNNLKDIGEAGQRAGEKRQQLYLTYFPFASLAAPFASLPSLISDSLSTLVPSLTNLDVKGNNLTLPSTLLPLQSLRRLTTLTLQDFQGSSNPVCTNEQYKSAVLASAPFLEYLDGEEATHDGGFELDDDTVDDIINAGDVEMPSIDGLSFGSPTTTESPKKQNNVTTEDAEGVSTPKFTAASERYKKLKAAAAASPPPVPSPVGLARIKQMEEQMKVLTALASEQAEVTQVLMKERILEAEELELQERDKETTTKVEVKSTSTHIGKKRQQKQNTAYPNN